LAKLLNKGLTKSGKAVEQDFRVRTTSHSPTIDPQQLALPENFVVTAPQDLERTARIKPGAIAAFANAETASMGSMLGYLSTGGQVTGARIQAGMAEDLKGVAH